MNIPVYIWMLVALSVIVECETKEKVTIKKIQKLLEDVEKSIKSDLAEIQDELNQTETKLDDHIENVQLMFTTLEESVIKKLDLGKACTMSGFCSDTNAECTTTSDDNKTCQCKTGYFDNNGDTAAGTCIAKLDLGTACTVSGSCSDTNAECTTTSGDDKKCQCKTGYVDNNGDTAAGTCIAANINHDCTDIKHNNDIKVNGVYRIKLRVTGEERDVYCDMETDHGGWTVFQRRQNGEVDFYRNWTDYEKGFGSLDGEFWMGLADLHRMTSSEFYELRFDLESFEGEKRYATYSNFYIEGSRGKYKIHVSGYNGTAGDSFSFHDGMMFSTYDQDNDAATYNCAVSNKGGWWYNICHYSNLNGLYSPQEKSSNYVHLVWYAWLRWGGSLKKTEMKIRRK